MTTATAGPEAAPTATTAAGATTATRATPATPATRVGDSVAADRAGGGRTDTVDVPADAASAADPAAGAADAAAAPAAHDGGSNPEGPARESGA